MPVVGSGEAAASLTGKPWKRPFCRIFSDHHFSLGNVASSSLAARASGRGRPQGVDPLAAQVSNESFASPGCANGSAIDWSTCKKLFEV